jgi:hypothetical protein
MGSVPMFPMFPMFLLQLLSIKILTWGVSSFTLGFDFCEKSSQEDNTPLSFYTEYFTLATLVLRLKHA